MNSKAIYAAAAAAVLATGTFIGSIETEAAPRTAAVETVVLTDYATSWDILTRALDEGDFEINATIRENSTIRVLLQSTIPSTWVDCGSVNVESKHKIFGDRNYKFLAANSVRYMVADEKVNELIDVERRSSLNALATVKLEPRDQGTLVSVDALYVMKFRTREFGSNFSPRALDVSLNFDSASEASMTEEIREGATMKQVEISCRPTGELERRIVSFLQAPAS